MNHTQQSLGSRYRGIKTFNVYRYLIVGRHIPVRHTRMCCIRTNVHTYILSCIFLKHLQICIRENQF